MAYNPFPASYNNGYPNNGYQPQYFQQPSYQPPMQQQMQYPMQSYQPMQSQQMPMSSNNGINWVSGEAGARAFYVEPGTSVWLMDSEELVGYVKTVNANGVPLPLEVYELTRRITPQPVLPSYSQTAIEDKQQVDLSEYVRKEDVELMISQEVERRLAEMPTVKNRKEKADA